MFTSCRSSIATEFKKDNWLFNLTIITFLMKKVRIARCKLAKLRVYNFQIANFCKCLAVLTFFSEFSVYVLIFFSQLRVYILQLFFSAFFPNWKKKQLFTSQFWGKKFTIAACKLRTEFQVYISQLLLFPSKFLSLHLAILTISLQISKFASRNSVFLFLPWIKK